jgi:hypothetical protein
MEPRQLTTSPCGNLGLTEDTLYLMDIAPCPTRRRDSAHDRMLCLMEVFGRMLAGRGIATANVAARLALPKRDPSSSLSQALLTRARCFLRWKVFCAESFQMFT